MNFTSKIKGKNQQPTLYFFVTRKAEILFERVISA
jgi:hypothetical protein